MSNPSSLIELARQAGLNDLLLKQGFRQVFGKMVFEELRSHRLDIAKQLLAEQNSSVTEIAHQVGHSNARALARAFRQKFGIALKAYQKMCR
ncbi:MAG: helix-turn-helix transcriptional regulator [Cyanobacteria bacterium P01_F01_bin.150]